MNVAPKNTHYRYCRRHEDAEQAIVGHDSCNAAAGKKYYICKVFFYFFVFWLTFGFFVIKFAFMKINFSIKSAVFAAAAAMCGAVFFASPAQAQTPAAALNFENERLELTGISSPGIWLIYSHASETSSEGNRVLFGSGTDGSDIKYVPFADLYTDSAFSFDTPFIAFRNLVSGINTTPRLRVAGISGGTATIEQSGQLLSVNIDDLTNVLSLTVTPAELSFQWQQRPSGANVPFRDSSIPSATMQVFTLPAGQEAQVLITDNAGLADVQTVALAAAVTPPVTPPFTQPENPASSPEWTVTLNTTAARISLFAAVDTGGEGLGPYSFSSATPNTRSGGTYVGNGCGLVRRKVLIGGKSAYGGF